jgi:hypothetical protein
MILIGQIAAGVFLGKCAFRIFEIMVIALQNLSEIC